MNIWNYFSENVTALRMRDNCWGVTQRNEAMEKAASITKAILQSFIVFIFISFSFISCCGGFRFGNGEVGNGREKPPAMPEKWVPWGMYE